MAHGALARCISPLAAIPSAAWHVGRGCSATSGRVSPADAGLLRRARLVQTTGFPRHTPYRHGNAELLRRAQVVLDFRVAPATPSWDGDNMGCTVLPSSAHHQRRVLSSPCRRWLRPAF